MPTIKTEMVEDDTNEKNSTFSKSKRSYVQDVKSRRDQDINDVPDGDPECLGNNDKINRMKNPTYREIH